MEDTACGCDCPLVKSGLCKSDRECPNFIESWWKEGERGEQKLVKDCAPRRVMLQQGILAQNIFGVQASVCDLRNTVDKLCSVLLDLTIKSKEFADKQNKQIDHIE